ncbi:MAG: hypothetical protein GY944_03255, partial [bacterium]|nr:hypothetical protein [bacterium]
MRSISAQDEIQTLRLGILIAEINLIGIAEGNAAPIGTSIEFAVLKSDTVVSPLPIVEVNLAAVHISTKELDFKTSFTASKIAAMKF